MRMHKSITAEGMAVLLVVVTVLVVVLWSIYQQMNGAPTYTVPLNLALFSSAIRPVVELLQKRM